jgi:DnaJ-class molecular chaperone
MEEDYYKILEVSRDASKADIDKAYRRLARKYHPDLNQEDKRAKQKFQQVQRAYEVLSHPEKREQYDRYGSSFESVASGGPGGPGWRATTAGGAAESFEDLDLNEIFGRFGGDMGGFGQIFGNAARGRARRGGGQATRRGRDLMAELQIPFTTAVTGGETEISVVRQGRQETLSVKIPAAIEDGRKIRLRGQGEPGLGGGPGGDLLITLRVQPHPCYRRLGRDLEVDLPVTLAEAALGATVDLPTPAGQIALKIPPHTSSGRRLRIKGQGVKTADGQKGDLYAIVQIVLPDGLDDSDREWIRALDVRHPASPRQSLKW